AVNYMVANSMPALPIAFDEYVTSNFNYRYMPGTNAKYLAVFDRNTRVSITNRSHWDYDSGHMSCDFAGMLTTGDCNYTPVANWWVFKAYAAMSGNIVTVTPSVSDGSGADATASVTTGQSIILVGRDDNGNSENVTVNLTNIGSAPG